MSVVRKSNVLTVKLAAVNDGSAPRKVAFGFTGNDVCHAVDEERGSKYYVLTDKEGNPVASAKEWMPNSTSGINREIAPENRGSSPISNQCPPAATQDFGYGAGPHSADRLKVDFTFGSP